MNLNNLPVIHIGYPKAASSTLQKSFFKLHPKINYLGKYSHDYCNRVRPFYVDLAFKKNDIKSTLDKYNLIKENFFADNKINIFSHESLADNYEFDILGTAELLKTIFKKAKIIIVLRNQIDLIRSLYDFEREVHYYNTPTYTEIKKGDKVLPIHKWLEINFFNKSFFEGLNYDVVVSKYIDLFGKQNVLILNFSDLKNNINNFIKKLSAFLEMEEKEVYSYIDGKKNNAAKSLLYIKLLEIRNSGRTGLFIWNFFNIIISNKLKQKIKLFIYRFKSKKTIINNEWKKKIRDHYQDSNFKLKDLVDIDFNNL